MIESPGLVNLSKFMSHIINLANCNRTGDAQKLSCLRLNALYGVKYTEKSGDHLLVFIGIYY